MPNEPLQQRTGYNQGDQPFSLSRLKFLGQPAVKCGMGDTTIITNSPVVPGENNPRTLTVDPVLVTGALFNRSGASIDYDLLLIDDQNNEYSLYAEIGVPVPLANNAEDWLYTSSLAVGGFICLPVGWKLVVRISSGSPADGQGVIAWPWAHDTTRNMVPIVAPLTTSISEFGPPKGRGWQLCGNWKSEIAGDALFYANFDSVPRTVAKEYFHLAGEDILSSAGPIGPIAPLGVSGTEPGFEVNGNQKGLILAYPDKIKVQANENQTTGPLYIFGNFAEFDLPKDMG